MPRVVQIWGGRGSADHGWPCLMPMSPRMKVIWLIISTALALTVASGSLHAQSCSFSISSLNFSNIDLTTNTTFTSTATFSASCNGTSNTTVRVCPNIEAGSGGTITGNPRFLLNGAQQLNFNLYQDSAYTSVWGSNLWG